MISRLISTMLLSLLCSASALAQEQPADYAVQLPLSLSGEGPWYRLDVPMALHFAARYGDLRDLRVFNAEGQALAYALVAGQGESRDSQQEQGRQRGLAKLAGTAQYQRYLDRTA